MNTLKAIPEKKIEARREEFFPLWDFIGHLCEDGVFADRCDPPCTEDFETASEKKWVIERWHSFVNMLSWDGKTLSFRYSGSEDQGEFENGSGFNIGYYTMSFLKSIKHVQKDDVFDDGGVEW